MRRALGFALAGVIGSLAVAGPTTAAPVHYALPDETAALAPGLGLDVAQANCGACHSADYIATQPRPANPTAFWTAEVTKMRQAYGAPIEDADVSTIVAYLAAAYGKPGGS